MLHQTTAYKACMPGFFMRLCTCYVPTYVMVRRISDTIFTFSFESQMPFPCEFYCIDFRFFSVQNTYKDIQNIIDLAFTLASLPHTLLQGKTVNLLRRGRKVFLLLFWFSSISHLEKLRDL